MASKRCQALPDGTSLICNLPAHAGPWHYDEIDDITWAQGRYLTDGVRSEDGQEGGGNA